MPQSTFDDLEAHITNRLQRLSGEWVGKHSGYETDLCKACALTCHKSTFWDATWKDYRIELKKGTSIWIDLVRLSRAKLQECEDANQDTVTLFFVPDKGRKLIQKVIAVQTIRLIKEFKLTKPTAKRLISLSKDVPRNLNAQASLTLKDVERLASFSLKRT